MRRNTKLRKQFKKTRKRRRILAKGHSPEEKQSPTQVIYKS